MSARITVSYETEAELSAIIALLTPCTVAWKRPRSQNGKYRKAYFKLAMDDDICYTEHRTDR